MQAAIVALRIQFIVPLAVSTPKNRGAAEPRGFFSPAAVMRTAFLIDGGFFLYRYRRLKGNASPRAVARGLHAMRLAHLRRLGRPKHALYRIFYYDCPPLTKKTHNPIDRSPVDFAKTPVAVWRTAFFAELRRLRKVAVRLGYLDASNSRWVLKKGLIEDLARGKIKVADLKPADVVYECRQKGVDMKIGLDIASMAYKRQVDQIVLVSGDSDFVAAAKLARREGIDFILDSMWATIRDDLHEHIDGLQSVFPKTPPLTTKTAATGPAPQPVADSAVDEAPDDNAE